VAVRHDDDDDRAGALAFGQYCQFGAHVGDQSADAVVERRTTAGLQS
jgi:hypothetical protein